MPAERVGLLLDSLSQNTGDKAIRLVIEDFLTTQSINYETVNPISFDPKRYSGSSSEGETSFNALVIHFTISSDRKALTF